MWYTTLNFIFVHGTGLKNAKCMGGNMEEKELQVNEAKDKKTLRKETKAGKKPPKKEKRAAKREKKASGAGRGLLVVVVILLTFNLAGVGVAVYVSLKAMDNSEDAKDSSQAILKIFKSELGAYGEYGETSEDDVMIADQYMIRSTRHISDAYLSGDVSELSDEDLETLQMASKIIDEIITDDMTPYEKEKAVYDWMTKNLSLDDGMMQVIPTAATSVDNPYGVLKGRKAVCVGFATTFRLFMQMLDIECMVIHNADCYHSWDLVKLDDEWYHVDVYSDVGVGNYASFNITDEVKGVDWDTEFFPAATGLKYNYYYNSMVVIDDVYDIPQAMRDAFENHEGGLYMKVKGTPTDQDMETAMCMVVAIDNCLMNNYGQNDNMPLYLNTFNWITGIDENEYIFAVTFGLYPDDTDEPAYSGDIDEEQANEALQDAFGDIFYDIDVNNQNGMWDGDCGIWEDDCGTWEDDSDKWNQDWESDCVPKG